MERTGLIQNNEFVESVVIDKLSADVSKERVAEIFEDCKDIKGATHCETAFRVYECYLNKKKE